MTDTRLDVAKTLKDLPAWRAHDGDRPAITRTLKFADFNAAFGFMTLSLIHISEPTRPY